MSGAQRLASARALFADEEAVDDQVQAALWIAQHKKFRPKTVIGLDPDRKSKHLASLASVPDQIAGRALVLYHLSDQRTLMGRFLDELGIAHENGLIKEDEVKPDPARLAPAAAAIAREFSADDVRLYFMTLLCQDPQTWGGLGGIVELTTHNSELTTHNSEG
jgi:hypothetical protein